MDKHRSIDEKKKEEIKRWDKAGIKVLTVTIIVALLATPLIYYQDEHIVTVKVNVQSVVPFQLSCIFMLSMVYLCYYFGRVLGSATYKRVSYNKKFPVCWDFNFTINMFLFHYLAILFSIINYNVYSYFRMWEFTEGGYRIVYLIPHNVIYLLVIQLILIVVAIGAFWASFTTELRGKESEKRPWRVRDMWSELLGRKAIYRGDEEYKKKIKSYDTKMTIKLLLIVLLIPIIMFILDLIGVF